MTAAEFGRVFAAVRGWPVHQVSLSLWRTGARRPSKATRVFIERATQGQIPESAWLVDG